MANVIVFCSGLAIMILEIMGARILAPLAGTTISVWANLIGIILLSISLGYYFGGLVADKKRNQYVLILLLLGAVFAIASIIPIKNFILTREHYQSLQLESLVVSLFLFLVPGSLLGMITTYTIRLKMVGLESVGRTNGTLYGISTTGSVIGVFFTSLYLIPNFTTSAIIIGLSALLLALTGALAIFKI